MVYLLLLSNIISVVWKGPTVVYLKSCHFTLYIFSFTTVCPNPQRIFPRLVVTPITNTIYLYTIVELIFDKNKWYIYIVELIIIISNHIYTTVVSLN